MSKAIYRPGTSAVDITAPGGIEALLAFHRQTFGDARMEAEGDGENGGDDGGDGSKVNEHGFPDATPVKDMAPEQQAAYWQHKARKHEDRVKSLADYDAIKAERDALKTKHQTDGERDLEAATTSAADKARAEERGKFATRLVAAEFRAANAGRIPTEKFAAVVDGIEPTKFLTAEGEVDADKVQKFVDGIAPTDSKKWPDTGQGRRRTGDSKSVASGRDLFETRHAKKS